MCFSAKASFIAAGALTGVGLLSVHKARKFPQLIPFASTPLIFAFQQAAEGVVWLTLTQYTEYQALHTASMYIFVFFAGSWWPTWVPLILYNVENVPRRKKIIFITLIMGITTSLLYGISLLTQNVTVTAFNHHLYYPTFSYPFYSRTPFLVLIENSVPYTYLASTVLPFFASSIAHVWMIGVAMGLACLTSQLFYAPSSGSVWCFFAAIMSGLIFWIVCMLVKKYEHSHLQKYDNSI